MMNWLPENVSTYGTDMDAVMHSIWNIVFVWFLLAEAVLFYFLIRYRKKKGQRAKYKTGNSLKEMSWVLIPAAIVLMFDLGIDFYQNPVWKKVKIDIPQDPDLVVKIEGQQFVWNMTYPGLDNKFGTIDDFKTTSQLYVPINKKVVFELSSKDVIHSFWVPNLRLKQDAVPGRVIKGWFEAVKNGTYSIGCAELCGSGHGMMRGQLHVLSDKEYQDWVYKKTPKKAKKALEAAADSQQENSHE
ncbi:MAG: cytochrome c oxidase subunit II [Deltaproteobacteria bacterium]|nr:cytochrome c oxidase subunit II [Deltaproteobacteria bacterium]